MEVQFHHRLHSTYCGPAVPYFRGPCVHLACPHPHPGAFSGLFDLGGDDAAVDIKYTLRSAIAKSICWFYISNRVTNDRAGRLLLYFFSNRLIILAWIVPHPPSH